MIAGDTMYISGQLGMDAKTMELVGPDVESQAKQALTNMGEILKCKCRVWSVWIWIVLSG